MENHPKNNKKTWEEPNIFSIVIENGNQPSPVESPSAGPNPS